MDLPLTFHDLPRTFLGPPTDLPLLVEQEVTELRAALASGRDERELLQAEMDAMRLELETSRELLSNF